MRPSILRVRTQYSSLKLRGVQVTLEKLRQETGVCLRTVQHAVKQFNLEIVTEEMLLEMSYEFAATICKSRNKYGLVTIEAIADERCSTYAAAYAYLRRKSVIREKWQILDRSEAIMATYEAGAAAFRKKFPTKKLTRKALAHEINCGLERMHGYLHDNPDFAKK